MVTVYDIIFLTIFTCHLVINAAEQPHKRTQNRIVNRQNKIGKNVVQKWEFELDDKLEFPRGDKEKLSKISAQWSDYYACSSQLARSSAAASRLPSVAVAVYEGDVARLPCGLCIAPDVNNVQWNYQEQESSFIPIMIDERMVVSDNGNLTIFRVRSADAGAYKCTIGQSAGGTVLLEVVEREEHYNVVKPPTSQGLYPAPDQSITITDVSILLVTSWAPWSECSVCGHVGRRQRYGMCYVKVPNKENKARSGKTSTTSTGLYFNATKILKLFRDFPGGIPCRSRLLPLRLRSVPAVARRRNEIMIGLCKVPCESVTLFEVRSTDGALLERANNTAGVYSLSQRLPPDPPSPVSENIFGIWGQKLVIVCPGTSLRDIPVTWRVGSKNLSPRGVDKASGGRVHLNARGDVILERVADTDANLYSCWQRDVLVGTVKLSVWAACPWRRRAMLVTAVFASALALRELDDALRRQRQRL